MSDNFYKEGIQRLLAKKETITWKHVTMVLKTFYEFLSKTF